GASEAAGVDIELHDPCIVRIDAMPIPDGEPLASGLDIYVAALTGSSTVGSAVAAAQDVNDALSPVGSRLQWTIVTTVAGAASQIGAELPANLRVQIVELEPFTRVNATSLVSPYQPIDQLLLLEADDVARCLENGNLKMIRAALGAAPRATRSLSLDRVGVGLWMGDERGQIMSVADRIGQPIPFLDRQVIQRCLAAKEI